MLASFWLSIHGNLWNVFFFFLRFILKYMRFDKVTKIYYTRVYSIMVNCLNLGVSVVRIVCLSGWIGHNRYINIPKWRRGFWVNSVFYYYYYFFKFLKLESISCWWSLSFIPSNFPLYSVQCKKLDGCTNKIVLKPVYDYIRGRFRVFLILLSMQIYFCFSKQLVSKLTTVRLVKIIFRFVSLINVFCLHQVINVP